MTEILGVAVPQSGAQLSAASQAWNQVSIALFEQLRGLQDAVETVESGNQTPGTDAFADSSLSTSGAAGQLRNMAEFATHVSGKLRDAADVVEKCVAQMHTIAKEYAKALARAIAQPAPMGPMQAKWAEQLAKVLLRAAAAACAAAVASLLSDLTLESADGDEEALDTQPFTDEEMERINELLDGDGSMPYRSVSQGALGDCYLLSTIVALMHTPEGADLLRQNIRKLYDANGKQIGYEVRIPGGNNDDWIPVTERYSDGVKEGGLGGVTSVVERAYGIDIGDTDLSDGGSRDAASQDLTGKDPTSYDNRKRWWLFGERYDANERDAIAQGVDDNRAVTAGTGGSGGPFKDGHATVTVHEGGPDGQEYPAMIYDSHAYTVLDADPERGVTLRNPHGYNTDMGDNTRADATFTISWEDFGTYFRSVTVSDQF